MTSKSDSEKSPLGAAAGQSGILAETLAHSAHSVLLLDTTGQILFRNSVATKLLGTGGLESMPLFREPVQRQILQTKHWNCVELHAPPERLGHLRQVAVVVEVGSLAPSTQESSGATNLCLLVIIPPQAEQQSSLADREEFLATAAHDLKNPLSAIFGYADTLVTSVPGKEISDRTRSMVAKMRSIAARSIDLVRNYQQLAELAQLKPSSPNARTDLNKVIKNVVEETFREDEDSLTVVFVPISPPVLLRLEKLPLERVIANLFGNALRYSPPGGTITISVTKSLSDSLWPIEIHLNNTGTPIPAEEIPKLFTRRYRGSTSTGTSGTGLGLFIVDGIISRIGGKVSVQSTKEGGTTFTIHLPTSCVIENSVVEPVPS